MNTTELTNEIRDLFNPKSVGKWNFYNKEIAGKNVSIKFYAGTKETDLQIFKIDNVSYNIGFNYATRGKTMQAVIHVLLSVFSED